MKPNMIGIDIGIKAGVAVFIAYKAIIMQHTANANLTINASLKARTIKRYIPNPQNKVIAIRSRYIHQKSNPDIASTSKLSKRMT